MVKYQGISGAPGIARGEAYLYIEDTTIVPKYQISDNDIEEEIARYQRAVKKAADEINDIKKNLNPEAEEEYQMLDSHLLMLYDPIFTEQVFENLRISSKNVEWVLYDQITALVDKLKASQDTYLQERTSDLHDVSRRVIDHLMYKKKKETLADVPKEAIVVTSDLRPSDTVRMNKQFVKGIVMDEGGRTSHTAILARSFGIPAVLGLGNISKKIRAYDTVIVDGSKGMVIVNPDEKTEQEYQDKIIEQKRREKILSQLKKYPCQTKDGHKIILKANIEIPEDADPALNYKAEGIGLFRSEFLFMAPDITPSEELQTAAYTKVLETMKGLPVTIRTLDVGGDKLIKEIENSHEKNPLLGWRAIRFCLDKRDIFKTQLRALLRASTAGNLRIMFPLISCEEELLHALDLLEEAKRELKAEGKPYKEDVPVGIMIEVPSAALASDILAQKADFFSIGTNDLIQYTMAIDRGNEKVAKLYNPYHPAILRLIRLIVDNAHEAGIKVGMCGEMAGSPQSALLLLALGLDELSMNYHSLPEVKEVIRSVEMQELKDLCEAIRKMSTAREINLFLNDWMETRFENTKE